MPRSFPHHERLPVAAIRVVDTAREVPLALAFALLYIGAAFPTARVVRDWPHPIWGATLFTSDAFYVFVFKVGLLLVVPLVGLRSLGYGTADFLLRWRPSPRSVLVLVLAFAAGLIVNVSWWHQITAATSTYPAPVAILRVVVGCIVVLVAAAIPEELVYRWGLQTRLERAWGRLPAIVTTVVLFTAWHLPTRFLLAQGDEGKPGNLASVLVGTGIPVFVLGLAFGFARDRWRNLPALVAFHWGIDTLPSVASFLRLPPGGH